MAYIKFNIRYKFAVFNSIDGPRMQQELFHYGSNKLYVVKNFSIFYKLIFNMLIFNYHAHKYLKIPFKYKTYKLKFEGIN